MPIDSKWWKEAVIYQVYPRSFSDGDGDGVGDLKGILSKVDYIASLGVDTVWLNPVYSSPGADNGYDISDYRAIDPTFGTLDDLRQLIAALHARGMRIIMDMVINHTSDEHEWFRNARRSRDDPYYDWYHWWPAEKGKPPFRCGFFDPEGNAWTYNGDTDSYYLHYFSPHQPDLNWENPTVREEIYSMLRFWLDMGVDGFRMDAITYISKDTSWPAISRQELKDNYGDDWGNYYATAPNLHSYLRELRASVTEGRDVVIIGESSGVGAERASDFVRANRKELDMLYQFEAIVVGYLPGEFKKIDPKGWSLVTFKEIYSRWDRLLEDGGWSAIYLGNHDQPRMVTRWGNDGDEFRAASAKLLFTFLLTMRGTPSLFNGDELGMTNIRFREIGQYQDIETKDKYAEIQGKGGDTEAFLVDQQLAGRDNSRTPFQWNAGLHAGFTAGKPWMTVNDNYRVINVAAQEGKQDSVLEFLRILVRFRREHKVLVYGGYRLLDPDHTQLYVYERWDDTERLLIVLNFTDVEVRSQRGAEGAVLINNYPDLRRENGQVILRPWQALAIKL